jgi:hypothetical protein
VPVPVAVAAGAVVARSRFAPAVLLAVFGLSAIGLVLVMGVIGAVVGLQPATHAGFEPSALARREIPPPYLRLYEHAGEQYGIDPWILAAIGWIETQHGRSTAPGVHSGVNAYGCCAGPMQFNVRNGPPSTWDSYGIDGNEDGDRSPYDPADAIPAAARYLDERERPRTTVPRCTPTTTPAGTSPTCSPRRPPTAALPAPADCRPIPLPWARCSTTPGSCSRPYSART